MATLKQIQTMIDDMDEDALYALIEHNMTLLPAPFYLVEKDMIQFMVNEESGNIPEMLTDTLSAKQILWLSENKFWVFGITENEIPDSAVFFLNEDPEVMDFVSVSTGEDFHEDGELDIPNSSVLPENFALHVADDTYILGSKHSDF